MSETRGSEKAANKKRPAFEEGDNASSQCRLVLNDPERGYERLCREAEGRYKYSDRLTKNALNAQYHTVYSREVLDAEGKQKYPDFGGGTWMKLVPNASKEAADRWIGVSVWHRVFQCYGLTLTMDDIEWKPSNTSFLRVFDSLDKDEVRNTGMSVQGTVRIINTYLTNWDFLRNSFTRAIGKSVAIQILLLDPDSPQAAYRADGLGISLEKMREEIHSNLRLLAAFHQELKGKMKDPHQFEVRLYDSAPVASIYFFGSVAYMGLHWMRQSSIQSPQLRVEKQKNAALFSSMEQHFDVLWEGASKRRVLPE